MGHPKLKKKTYSKPTHPWQKERLEEEKGLLKEFGLKNKEEIWRVSSKLRKYAKQAKTLITLNTPQSEIERAHLLKKLSSLGLIEETAKLEDVLTITLTDILNRRLQTLVCKKNLAKSIRQSRQFITHEHILIGEKKITSPSYLVSKQEESILNFASNSPLFSQDHPERAMEKEAMPVVKEKKAKKEEKKETTKEEKPKSQKSKISEGLETKSQSKEAKSKDKPKEEKTEEKPKKTEEKKSEDKSSEKK
jgi:small subunit ribosomal protein S4